jgi:Xaa-Pro dipeptidase
MVVAGPDAGLAFSTWHHRPIQKDDVVYIEAGGTFERYNAVLSRTIIVGRKDEKWIRMAAVSKEALNLAIEAVKPGVTSGEVDRVCRDHIRKAGYAEYFQHRTGYSIGIGFPPDWGEGRTFSIKEGDPAPLQAGMVLHLIPDLKTLNEGGVVFSETVLVTEKGHELLTSYPQEIFYK